MWPSFVSDHPSPRCSPCSAGLPADDIHELIKNLWKVFHDGGCKDFCVAGLGMHTAAEYEAELSKSSLEVIFFESINKLRTTRPDWLARLREALQEKEHFAECLKVLDAWEQQHD